MTAMKEKTLIGRAEKVMFPMLGNAVTYARIDTGAKTSSVWASDISVKDGVLFATFPFENGDTQKTFKHFEAVNVSSSMGMVQERYKVRLTVQLKKRKILSTFTLADRSTQVYPVLIGRNTLMGKFIVDVSRGTPLKEEEERRSQEIQNYVRSNP